MTYQAATQKINDLKTMGLTPKGIKKGSIIAPLLVAALTTLVFVSWLDEETDASAKAEHQLLISDLKAMAGMAVCDPTGMAFREQKVIIRDAKKVKATCHLAAETAQATNADPAHATPGTTRTSPELKAKKLDDALAALNKGSAILNDITSEQIKKYRAGDYVKLDQQARAAFKDAVKFDNNYWFKVGEAWRLGHLKRSELLNNEIKDLDKNETEFKRGVKDLLDEAVQSQAFYWSPPAPAVAVPAAAGAAVTTVATPTTSTPAASEAGRKAAIVEAERVFNDGTRKLDNISKTIAKAWEPYFNENFQELIKTITEVEEVTKTIKSNDETAKAKFAEAAAGDAKAESEVKSKVDALRRHRLGVMASEAQAVERIINPRIWLQRAYLASQASRAETLAASWI